RAERRPHQRLRLLLHHREEAVPHDLQFDLRDIAAGHAPVSSMTISPPAAMRAVKPDGTIVEVPSSTITAGPAMPAPGGNDARANTAAGTGSPVVASTMRRRRAGAGAATSGTDTACDGSACGCDRAKVQVSASTSSRGMMRPN